MNQTSSHLENTLKNLTVLLYAFPAFLKSLGGFLFGLWWKNISNEHEVNYVSLNLVLYQ